METLLQKAMKMKCQKRNVLLTKEELEIIGAVLDGSITATQFTKAAGLSMSNGIAAFQRMVFRGHKTGQITITVNKTKA